MALGITFIRVHPHLYAWVFLHILVHGVLFICFFYRTVYALNVFTSLLTVIPSLIISFLLENSYLWGDPFSVKILQYCPSCGV